MARIFMELIDPDDEHSTVLVSKEGEAMHLLTEARNYLRRNGTDGVIHLSMCLADGCEEES